MDPSAPPTPISSSDSSPSSAIPTSVLQQVQSAQGRRWMVGRLKLSRLVAANHTHQPELLLHEELKGCTLEEHDLAAQLITSDEEGVCSLQDIRRQLRKLYCVDGTSSFNPIQEYRNIGANGDNRAFSQDKLCNVRDDLQDQGESTMPRLQYLFSLLLSCTPPPPPPPPPPPVT